MPDQEAKVNPEQKTEPETWYGKDEFTADQLPTVSRYKTRQAFNEAFFQQRKTIAEHAAPPDPTKMKPEEYAEKMREYRSKVSGRADAKAVKIVWPKDIAGYVEGKVPDFGKDLLEDAIEFGLTQAEIDAKVEKVSAKIRDIMKAEETQAATDKQAKDTAVAEADKKLRDLWGDATETNTNNAMLFFAKQDDTLLFKDNEGLSEEERADRGGLLAQDVRNLPPDVRQRFLRLGNNLWGRLYGESQPTDGGTGGNANLYADRLAKVKQMYPNRKELWEEYARSNIPL